MTANGDREGPKTKPSEALPTVAAQEDEYKGPHPRVLQTFEMIARDFWPNVEKTECCWIWRGHCETSRGGPRFHLRKDTDFGPRYTPAHHVAWLLEKGHLPKPKSLVRLCDQRLCVRPSHYQRRVPPENPQRKRKRKKSPEPEPALQSVPKSGAVTLVSGAQEQAASLLAALGAELRAHAVAEREAARHLVARLDATAKALLALRQVAERQADVLSLCEERLGGVEERLGGVDAELAGLRDRLDALGDAVAALSAPPADASPGPEPKQEQALTLREALCDGFHEYVGGQLDPAGPDGAYLDDALDLALRLCDADGQRAGRTVERWLRWYGALVRRGEDGQGPEPTARGFLRAVCEPDETRPPPWGPGQ